MLSILDGFECFMLGCSSRLLSRRQSKVIFFAKIEFLISVRLIISVLKHFKLRFFTIYKLQIFRLETFSENLIYEFFKTKRDGKSRSRTGNV